MIASLTSWPALYSAFRIGAPQYDTYPYNPYPYWIYRPRPSSGSSSGSMDGLRGDVSAVSRSATSRLRTTPPPPLLPTLD